MVTSLLKAVSGVVAVDGGVNGINEIFTKCTNSFELHELEVKIGF